MTNKYIAFRGVSVTHFFHFVTHIRQLENINTFNKMWYGLSQIITTFVFVERL